MKATAMWRRSFLYLIASGSFKWSRIMFHQLVVTELNRFMADSAITQEKAVEVEDHENNQPHESGQERDQDSVPARRETLVLKFC